MPDELVSEWVQKAEEDWIGIERIGADDLAPVADLVVFLAQQCAEKYLKALLVESGVPFPRTHDLEALLGLLVPLYPPCKALQGRLESLTDMAVEVRYPGAFAERDDAREAMEFGTVGSGNHPDNTNTVATIF